MISRLRICHICIDSKEQAYLNIGARIADRWPAYGILLTHDALELTSSVSVLLLAFGLIASMANALTKGSVLPDNLIMQRIWAWTQCIAIDASVARTIIRTFRYHVESERVKAWLRGALSVLLLFTAAIVSNIKSVQQTLNVTLDVAYIHVFIPV